MLHTQEHIGILPRATNRVRRRALFLLFFTAIFPHITYAISLDKSVYTAGETPVFTSSGGPWVVYDITTNTAFGGYGTQSPGDELFNTSELLQSHNYSVIETTEDGVFEDLTLDYNGCKTSSYFVGEFLFTGVSLPSSDGGGGGGFAVSSGGVAQYGPEIEISFPTIGAILSRLGTISYKATDRNDQGKENERNITNTE